MSTPQFVSETRAREFIETIDTKAVKEYETYFGRLGPIDDRDVFRRALFAFASVHTTWKSNCALYNTLYDLSWLRSKEALAARTEASGAGLHNNRTEFIWEFSQKFWAHPDWFAKQHYEDWLGYRDRLMASINGLGLAKTAFFAELVYLQRNEIACMDVHLLRLFGNPDSRSGAPTTFVRWCEQKWLEMCSAKNISPTTARWLYWDSVQEQPDSRYWTHVLEGPPQSNPFTGQLFLSLRN